MQIANNTTFGRKLRRVIAGLIAATAFSQMTTPSTLAAVRLEDSPSASANAATYALVRAKSRAPASNFILTDINGKKVKLSDYRGHVVLLDFWAVDCAVA